MDFLALTVLYSGGCFLNAESPRLQFIIVLRVIIVHFVVNLMKLMQVGCSIASVFWDEKLLLFLADMTVLAKSGAKIMICIEKRDKKAEKILSRLPFLIFL